MLILRIVDQHVELARDLNFFPQKKKSKKTFFFTFIFQGAAHRHTIVLSFSDLSTSTLNLYETYFYQGKKISKKYYYELIMIVVTTQNCSSQIIDQHFWCVTIIFTCSHHYHLVYLCISGLSPSWSPTPAYSHIIFTWFLTIIFTPLYYLNSPFNNAIHIDDMTP